MTLYEFTVEFHTPFRVGTQRITRTHYGAAHDGACVAAPGSAIKGMMRDAASSLELPHSLIEEVFGASASSTRPPSETEPTVHLPGDGEPGRGKATPSPWGWSDLVADSIVPVTRTRVAINATTGSAEPGALMTVGEYVVTDGVFSIERIGHIDVQRRQTHVLVLEAAAALMSAFGADRRRGLGWISCTRTNPEGEVAAARRGNEFQRSKRLDQFAKSILALRHESGDPT